MLECCNSMLQRGSFGDLGQNDNGSKMQYKVLIFLTTFYDWCSIEFYDQSSMEFLSSQPVLHNFISSVAQNFIARFSLIPNNLGPLQIRSNLNTWINITYCYQYNNHNLYSRHVKEYKSLSQSVEEAGNSWGSSGHQGITGFAVHQHFRYKSQLGLAAA